jgi:hypothetical protein
LGAIEAAVARAVPDRNPLHWGTNTLPGQDSIYGLSAYRGADHWLLVTFGLTDLFGPIVPNAQVSGWGFGRPFEPGHRMDPGGPITGKPDTRLTALAFAEDLQLPHIDSPLGSARFLTVVGITADELAQMKATSTQQVLDTLAAGSPTLITDPSR